MPVIPGRNSWLMWLGWPWSSAWWQWVQMSPASSCATDLKVKFAQCWGDPKLPVWWKDGSYLPAPQSCALFGNGAGCGGCAAHSDREMVPGGDALLPPLNWVLLKEQETVSWHWLCHSTTCKKMLYYKETVAELGKGVVNCDKVHMKYTVLWEGI